MDTLLSKSQFFPCPLCSARLDVRSSKKDKPYVVCEGCGIQMFVRQEIGIRRFQELIAKGKTETAMERLVELEKRYLKKCPECGRKFWISLSLIKTHWFDGEATGFKCPTKDCDGVVAMEEE